MTERKRPRKEQGDENQADETGAVSRFENLLKKTENFAKAIDTGVCVEADGDMGISRKHDRRAKMTAGTVRRHQASEEDEQELMDKPTTDVGPMLFDKSPSYIKNGEMRDYQIRGLNWMIQLQNNGINGILADEMGLGKTLQTIALLGYMKHCKKDVGPYLVINPKSTCLNWIKEIEKWCPTLKAVSLIGDKDERKAVIQEQILSGEFDVLVTSYNNVLSEKSILKKFAWTYIVIDEAQRIKNEDTKLAVIVRSLSSSYRLLLTGTPLQNNLHELWALLNFLLPEMFSSSEDFDAWFAANSINDQSVVSRLHKLLQPFMLRRIKSDVEKSLLPKKEIKVYVGMSKLQLEWYQKVLLKEIDILNGAGEPAKSRSGPPYTTDQHIVDNSGKMVLLNKLLPKLQEQGSRVLLFSQFKMMLDIFEDYCIWKNYKYCRLDGDTHFEDRQQEIEEYNRDGSEKFIFMLTTRAGGLGINLATADVVIIYDSDWNPQVDLQAMDRSHRIGQKKQVRIFRFISENTVDERIIERAEMKLRLDSIVIQQGRVAQAAKTLDKGDLLSMIRCGANMVFASKDSTISDEDIDAILARSEDKTKEFNEKMQKFGGESSHSLATEYDSSKIDGTDRWTCYNWNGKDWRKEADRSQGGLTGFWIKPSKRERRKVNYGENRKPAPESSGSDVELVHEASNTLPKRSVPPPKLPNAHDFQLYPRRLFELLDQEMYHYRKVTGWKPPKKGHVANAEEKLLLEQEKIDRAKPLTDDEKAERDELIKDGFPDWSHQEFSIFVAANEAYGRENIDAICDEIKTKTREQVVEYAKAFWVRLSNLANGEKILARIEKGEGRIERNKKNHRALAEKIAKYSAPYHQLKITYGHHHKQARTFTENEDRFLVCELYRIGPEKKTVYNELKESIHKTPQFRLNWYLKSRTPAELERRCNTLLLLIEKEMHERDLNKDQKHDEPPQSKKSRLD
ncbi:unnamed protein product, partial [Mesorhabditis belari]|uniref:Uncharacterized protein n=1 Tax=Mesorhabditis belari TaxID=2138241 RepID=A0AAF3FDM8_9BILA